MPAVFSRSAIIGRYEPKNNQRVLLPTVLCSLQCCSTDPHGLRLIVCNFETVRVVRSSKHEWLIFVLFACQVTTCKPAQVISNIIQLCRTIGDEPGSNSNLSEIKCEINSLNSGRIVFSGEDHKVSGNERVVTTCCKKQWQECGQKDGVFSFCISHRVPSM